MRLFKKVAALLLAVTLAVPAISVAASQDSPQTQFIKGTTTNGVYNGQIQSDLVQFTDEAGNILKEGDDYQITNVEWTGNDGTQNVEEQGSGVAVKNAGTYIVTAEGKGHFTGGAETKVTIEKATPVISPASSSVSYQMYKVYNKTLKVTVKAASSSGEPVRYRLTKYGTNRGFSVNADTGVVTHPKNSVATYKVGDANVYAYTDESLNYKAADSFVATITIKKSYPHITFGTQSKKYTKAAVDSRARSYSIGATAEPGAKLAYKVLKGEKYISVSKSGKVTVKKGTPKGTYKIQVYNTNTSQYYPGPTNCYVTVK